MFIFRFFLIWLYCLSSCYASFDNLLNDLQVYHGITVKYPSENYTLQVDASSFRMQLDQQLIFGDRSVRVSYQDMLVTANRFEANLGKELFTFIDDVSYSFRKMTLASYRLDLSLPDNAYAKGNVEFYFNDYSAYSNEASYNLDENVIVLEGDAILYENQDFFKGETISFDLNQQTVLSHGRSKVKLSTERLP